MSGKSRAPSQLEELTQALAGTSLSRTSTLAFAMAGQGTLPIIELFTVAAKLSEAGQGEQTAALYHVWLKHTKTPVAYAAWFNLAVTLLQSNDEAGAEQGYRKAIALKPDFIEGYLNLGSLQERMRLPDQALETWRIALAKNNPAQPDSASLRVQTLNNLGRLLEIRKNFPDAEEMLTQSILVNPKQPNVLTHLVHLRQKQCKWPIYQPIAGVSQQELEDATSALATLSASDDPAVQLAASRRYVKEKVLHGVPPLAPPEGYVHPRLRVGYLSSDLHSHAVAILTAELFELHNREQVEVYAFCWSNEDGSPLRARVVRAMDHLIRIDAMSDRQAAECIRSHEIDILVDLHGLTLGTRPDILSYRPAPVQVTWLGFPGPTALPCIDYVVADEFVLPPALAPFFTEKPLYMPHTFQINDRQRAIGATPTRAGCGLPEDKFVFCSFNNNHKFTPDVFATWMRILQRTPDSVLWLVSDSKEVQDNLYAAAEAQGVARERLHFAGRVLPADYLARFQVADLFLDTLPFNAGTTASDALWAGLPLLTLAGRSFGGRMAGSLLRAVGLPELVTHTPQEYEDAAVRLATHPAELAELRQRLARNRLTEPLFDSPRFARDFEAALLTVARGEIRADSEGAPQLRGTAAAPLVSLLMPTNGHPELLARALDSALAQTWEHCEIVIADASADGATEALVTPYLARHRHIKYVRKPGLDTLENLQRSVMLSSGKYINFLTEGCTFHPDKIGRMLQYYLHYPTAGLVTSAVGPHAPMFPGETVISGASLGDMMLTSNANPIGGLSAPLLRRADADTPGMFCGRQYSELGAVASWLEVLSGRDCLYLPETLSTMEAQPAGPMAPVVTAIEWMQLLLDAHKKRKFIASGEVFYPLLAAKLTAFSAYVAGNHAILRMGGFDVEQIHQVTRQGYQALLEQDGIDAASALIPLQTPA
jgi:predicted O-linked N-acetylglucosamine transferase (SPINDLY family)